METFVTGCKSQWWNIKLISWAPRIKVRHKIVYVHILRREVNVMFSKP